MNRKNPGGVKKKAGFSAQDWSLPPLRVRFQPVGHTGRRVSPYGFLLGELSSSERPASSSHSLRLGERLMPYSKGGVCGVLKKIKAGLGGIRQGIIPTWIG